MGRGKVREHLESSDPGFAHHLRRLSMDSVEAYRRWCEQQGFSRKLKKGEACRGRELQRYLNLEAAQRVGERRRESRRKEGILCQIVRGELRSSQLSQPHFVLFANLVQRRAGSPQERDIDRKSLLQLLEHLQNCRIKFLDGRPALTQLGATMGNSYLEALALIATYRQHWLRPLQNWKPKTRNTRRQFSSLVRHLFSRHDDLPRFFDSVWFLPRDQEGAGQRGWFLHVGKGKNIRTCDLPIRYTKRMSHYFQRAPQDCTVPQAIRWGQVRGLGGTDHLAQAFLGCRLAANFHRDEFWSTVIAWFVRHPMLDPSYVGPIVDYLHHRRFVPQQVFIENGRREETPPAEPNLTLKGRTPEVLLRRVDDWHRRLAIDNTHQVRQWRPSGIDAFCWAEGQVESDNRRQWTIRELLSNKALTAEGRKLRHCVATYAASCSRGHSAIWTMESETKEGMTKLLTIEVHPPTRQIRQIRGKANRLATAKEISVIQRWATEAGLQISRYA